MLSSIVILFIALTLSARCSDMLVDLGVADSSKPVLGDMPTAMTDEKSCVAHGKWVARTPAFIDRNGTLVVCNVFCIQPTLRCRLAGSCTTKELLSLECTW